MEDINELMQRVNKFGELLNKAKWAGFTEQEFFDSVDTMISEREKSLSDDFKKERERKKKVEEIKGQITYYSREIESLKNDSVLANKRLKKYDKDRNRILDKYIDGVISLEKQMELLKDLDEQHKRDLEFADSAPGKMERLQQDINKMQADLSELE